ncbi:hypothetical protein D3C72_2001860 [compost metagenome]
MQEAELKPITITIFRLKVLHIIPFLSMSLKKKCLISGRPGVINQMAKSITTMADKITIPILMQ